MKYFGKKSLSSVMCGVLNAARIICFVFVYIAPIAAGLVIFMSTPQGEQFRARHDRCLAVAAQPSPRAAQLKQSDSACTSLARHVGAWCMESNNRKSDKDKRDWEQFKRLPLIVKILIIPYVEAVLILLLAIFKRSRYLFLNFRNDIVFNRNNVPLISKISKLNIWFSILTFSFSSLLVSLFLFMLCEIINNGAVLQEEHDLTV